MAKTQTLRFASGSLLTPYSSIWRVWTKRNDVYVGFSKVMSGLLKMSLHESGVWIFSATQQSGLVGDSGNRRVMQWKRPAEYAKGVTRGPSILVPHTSVGSRQLVAGEVEKQVRWVRQPNHAEMIEFSFYFVSEGANGPVIEGSELMGILKLTTNGSLMVFASCLPMPTDFGDRCEKLLREHRPPQLAPINGAPHMHLGTGGVVWIAESGDSLKIPILVDLPAQPYANASEASRSFEGQRQFLFKLRKL